MADKNIQKDIEKHGKEIARTLRPHLLHQSVIDADTGRRYDQKRVTTVVEMTGTSQEFKLPDNITFGNPESVIVTLNPESAVAMYGWMIAGNRYKITAASALTKVKIKVLMRGY